MNNTSSIRWRKSSHSGQEGTDCVETASLPVGTVGIRDSKNPGGLHLEVSRDGFGAFRDAIKAGRFDAL